MERQVVTPSGVQPGRGVPPDDAAAERLYSEYSGRLLAFCFKQLRSRAEAEDAVQITFLCALRALRRGVVPESESAWLHAIARNVCRWQQRTTARRPVSSAVDVDSVAMPASEAETGRLSGLREALESLPERQRQALVLREWRGLSPLEIADYLHLSPPATHALLTRARRSLAHALTAPQRAALGTASLAYELRSWLKAALGGASAKVAVATVAVVGTGVGGVVVDQSIAGDRNPQRFAESPRPAPTGPAGSRTAATSRTGSSAGAVGPSVGGAAPAPARRGTAPRGSGTASVSERGRTSGPHQTIRGRTRPGATAGFGSAPTQAPGPREPDTTGTDPPAGIVPLDPPELPPANLPPPDLPPVDVPPVDAPIVDLPADVPPIDLPPIDVPPVDPPPPTLPPLLP